MASILVGYLACAACFYLMAARTALKVEDNITSIPSGVPLTIVEGGADETSDIRQVA